jgi:hypothetical protein
MKTPREVLDGVIEFTYFFGDVTRRWPKPGQQILMLSEERRKILKELKSDDLVNIRPDSILGWPEIILERRVR